MASKTSLETLSVAELKAKLCRAWKKYQTLGTQDCHKSQQSEDLLVSDGQS